MPSRGPHLHSRYFTGATITFLLLFWFVDWNIYNSTSLPNCLLQHFANSLGIKSLKIPIVYDNKSTWDMDSWCQLLLISGSTAGSLHFLSFLFECESEFVVKHLTSFCGLEVLLDLTDFFFFSTWLKDFFLFKSMQLSVSIKKSEQQSTQSITLVAKSEQQLESGQVEI